MRKIQVKGGLDQGGFIFQSVPAPAIASNTGLRRDGGPLLTNPSMTHDAGGSRSATSRQNSESPISISGSRGD
jgi:hypothetical protein